MPSPSDVTYVEQIARLYEQAPLLVALFDPSDHLVYANPAFRKGYGVAGDKPMTWLAMMRKGYNDGVGAAIQTSDIEDWLLSAQSRRGKIPYRAFEADLMDGRWMYVTETTDEGWILCVAFDITAMRTSERSLRQARDGALRAAQTDTLTGISNRAHILMQMEQRLEQLRSAGRSCGVVMLDLDHFKRVNDTYGHYAGDLVLKHFTKLVAGTLRREDGFGRFGGEEFLLLFPNIEAPALTRIVGRVLEMVCASAPLSDAPDFRYTCSAGVALLQSGLDIKENINNADRALYAAKASGRNRLEWAD